MGSQANQIATELEAKTIGGVETSSASSTKCATKAFAQSVGCLVGGRYSPNQLVRYIHLSKSNTKYRIKCYAGANGEVTADKSEARIGETVRSSATPDSGYVTSSFSIKTDAGSNVSHKSGIFTMPADNVTVSATFKEYVPSRPNAYMHTYNSTPCYGRTQNSPNVAFPLEDAPTETQASSIAQENTIQYYLVASPNDYGQHETVSNFFDNTQQYCMGVGFWGFSGQDTRRYTNVFGDVYETWDNFTGSGSNKIEHIELCGGWFNVLDEENWGYSVGYVGANGENWYEVNSVAELVAVPVRTDNLDNPSFAVRTYFLDGCPWPFTDYGGSPPATFRRDQPEFGYDTNDISYISFTNLQPGQQTGTDVLTNKHWSSTYAGLIVNEIMPKIVSSNGRFEIVRHAQGLCIRTFEAFFCKPDKAPNEGLRFALFCYSDDVLQDVIWTENYVDTTQSTYYNESVMCFVQDPENTDNCDILFAYDSEMPNPDFAGSVVRTHSISNMSNADIINNIIGDGYNRITLYIQVYDMDGKDFPAYENQFLKTCFRVDQTYGASRWYTLWTHAHDHCMMWQYDD